VKKFTLYISTTIVLCAISLQNFAQCSLCTKTAQQLGEKPALGLNNGILYLMLTPFAIMGFISYRWWKSEKARKAEESAPSND
jgi:hypothetical protein